MTNKQPVVDLNSITTLDDLKPQKIFSYVASHLLAQNKLSSSTEYKLALRGLNSTSCAIGCILPDRLYLSELENKTASELFYHSNQIATYFSGHKELLSQLMSIHDTSNLGFWRDKLKKLAIDLNLVFKF